jgi:3-oxoadipate enol-lactonase
LKRKLSVNAGELAYTDQGEGNALILLHGFCGSSAYWDRIVPALSRHYRVIVADLRGHGESSEPVGEVQSMEAFADDAAALIREVSAVPAVVFGHSLGGYISLAVAERYPELLAGFALIHSTAHPDPDEARLNRNKSIEAIKQKGIETFVDGLVPKLFAAAHQETMGTLINEAKAAGSRTSPQGAIAALGGMRDRPDRNSVLSGTTLPVLIVAGDNDSVVPPERAFSVSGSHIRQFTLKQAGHMGMYEAPERLGEEMLRFAKEVYGETHQ